MAELEQSLEELKVVKQAFKENINANDVSTANVEFRNMPYLLKQMEKKLPTQTKSINPTISAQSVTADIGYKLTEVNVNAVNPSDYYKPEQSISVIPKTTSQTITPTGNSVYNKINVEAVTSSIDSNLIPTNIRKGTTILGVQGNLEADKPDQQKTVNPTISQQSVVADNGYELAKVTINAVTSAIDSNIQANNIKKGVSILGITGTLEGTVTPKLQEKTIEPTTNTQSIVADGGYDGLSKVNISAVTRDIDGNIKPENIKKDVSILGVIGSLVQSSGDSKFSEFIDGTIASVEEEDLKDVTSIRDDIFNGLSIGLVSIPSNVSSIGTNAFSNNKINTLIINEGVTTIGASAFENNKIEVLTIPESVTTIGASAFAGNNLTEITMQSDTPPVVTNTTFPNTLKTTNVSYNGYPNYESDPNWQTYKDTLVRGLAIPSTIIVEVNNYLGELVNGVNVTITGNEQTFTGTTNEQGIFIQGDLQPATYTISVSNLDDFKTPSIQEIVVQENTQNNVQFTYLEKIQGVEFDRVFGNNTPATISAVSAEISANNMTSAEVEATYGWKLGDTILLKPTSGNGYNMRIIGFNHDYLSDGTGKAGITLEMTGVAVNGSFQMNTSTNTNAGGYASSRVKTYYLPWLKNLISQEWKDVIKLVDKKSANGGGDNYSETLTLSEDLFILSEIELFGDASKLAQAHSEEGSQYEYWIGKSNEDRIKSIETTSTKQTYWLRSSVNKNTQRFMDVDKTGGAWVNDANGNCYVSYAFCV